MLAETEAFTRRPIIFMDDHACTRRIFVSDAAMPRALLNLCTRPTVFLQICSQRRKLRTRRFIANLDGAL